jgi:hypothetical protein
VAACDGIDGEEDGLISDPRACRFGPAVLRCRAGQDQADTSGLSAVEVDTVKKLYEGPKDPVTGERLTIGAPPDGSALAWEGVFVPAKAGGFTRSGMVSTQAISNFKLADFAFDRATFDRLRAAPALRRHEP